ncbi:unnamed protein product [Schistocephalus solidus]|uniref:C2H2-type domain-containing protein n=1 Tax=Schistocephalus solidus TaxID=70667 RepID=A0A183TA69_SCHSO|nr:unnamed protein product [Schistocephalus solidus]
MPRPCKHTRAVNASSARESAWLGFFGRNAPTIRQFQLLRQILPTLLQTPHPHSWHQFRYSHHIETTSQYSLPVTPTTATTTIFAFTTTTTTTTTTSDWDSLLNCPQCDRTFTSRIDLVGHLRIHRIETGESVPGAPTLSRDHRLHCPRAFTHRMGLFGQMRVNDSGRHRNADNTDTSCIPFAPAILTATATPTTMNDIPQPLAISPAHNAPAFSTQHRPGRSPANPSHGGW